MRTTKQFVFNWNYVASNWTLSTIRYIYKSHEISNLSWFSIPMFQWFLLAIHRWMDPVTQQPHEASGTRIFLNSVSSAKPFTNYVPMKNISQLGTCRFFLQPILGIYTMYIYIWLVVYLPLWKIWKSVGMIIPKHGQI